MAIWPTISDPRFSSTASALRVKVTVLEPPAFLAVTVTLVGASTFARTPVIAPVVELRTSPAGRAGETAQDATGPPVLVGVSETGLCVLKVHRVTFPPPRPLLIP